MGTHKEIKDKLLRSIMANELLVIRKQFGRMGYKRTDDSFFWAVVGFETALRRVQLAKDSGML